MRTEEHRANNDEISIKEIIVGIKTWFFYLLSKWKILIPIGLLGSFLGWGYAMIKKPVYTAETTFVLEDSKAGGGALGSLGGLASMAGIDIGGGGGGLFQGDNIIELYKSRSMVEKTLLSEVDINGKSQLLVERYMHFTKVREGWKEISELRDIGFQGSKFTRVQDNLMGKFVKEINGSVLKVSKPDKKLSIIRVEVSFGDEVFAKMFNDQIVKNVNDSYVQTKTKKAVDNLSSLQNQTDSVRNVLYGAITSTAAVVDATPNLNPTRQVLRASGQRSQFNAEANKVVLSTLIQNLELAKLSLRNETPLIQVIDSPVFPLNMEKVGKAKAMVVGGLLFGFAGVFIIVLRKVFYKIINE